MKPAHLLNKSPGLSDRGTASRRTSSSHGETLESAAHTHITPGELTNANAVGAQLLPHAPSHPPSQIHPDIVLESPVASFSTSAAEGDCREPAPLLSTNHEHHYGGTSLSPVGLLEPSPTLNSSSGASGNPYTVLPARDLPGDTSTPSTSVPVAAVREVAEGPNDVLHSTVHTLTISPSSVPLQVEATPPAIAEFTSVHNKDTTLGDEDDIVDAGSETSEHYADLAPEMAFFLDISSPPAFETTVLRDEDVDDVVDTAPVPMPNVARANDLRAPVDGNREAYGDPLTDDYEDSQDGCAFATSRNIVACALAQVNGDALLIG